ncbi:MAG TPA: histidine phosphatase family protein [Solirubrobacteraceae bacterium]
MSDLYLARHGQTAYNAEGRFQGWSPVPLDATGRAQALELAVAVRAVAPVTLVCSDIARAHETATIVGGQIGLEPVVDARFAETETGDWTDRTFEEVHAEDPAGFERFIALDAAWGFPGGESFAQQAARVQAGLDDWRGRAGAHPVVVVCHGNVIRLALRAAGRAVPERPENGSLVAL